MTRYAVPLHDLEAIWRTPMGAALVEAVLDDDRDGELVTVRGGDAIVLTGNAARVSALVAGLLRARFPGGLGRSARVYSDEGRGWQQISTSPPVSELPDDPPTFADAAAEEVSAHG